AQEGHARAGIGWMQRQTDGKPGMDTDPRNGRARPKRGLLARFHDPVYPFGDPNPQCAELPLRRLNRPDETLYCSAGFRSPFRRRAPWTQTLTQAGMWPIHGFFRSVTKPKS